MAKIHDRIAIDLPFRAPTDIVTVDDPFALRDFAAPSAARRRDGDATEAPATELRADRPDRVRAVRNLRDDPLAGMHARRHITDAQYRAGRSWQALYERAELRGVKAFDWRQPKVSGGCPRRPPRVGPITRATSKLKALDAALGTDDADLLRGVLGHGRSLRQWAAERGRDTVAGRKAIGQQFRAALDKVARKLGL
jgi:hypothetical protein